MFSRRYSTNTGRGRARFTGNETYRHIDRYRNQLVQSINSSRNIYEAIVENIRRENDILFSLMPLVEHLDSTTPATSESGYDEVARSNMSSQSLGTPAGVQRTNIQVNPFQSLFMDITNMLVNSANSPEVNRGLTNEQISVAIQDALYGNLPSDVRESHTICPITLDQFEDSMEVGVIRACGHIFRKDAIINWLSTRHTCPSCRRNLNEPVISGNRTLASVNREPNSTEPATYQQSGVSSTHPIQGLHFINPTVRRAQAPNQQVNLVFDGIIGVPNSVGDEGTQQQHIVSLLDQMFSLPDITDRTSQRIEQPILGANNTIMGALGEIVRSYESEPENDGTPE